jgi:hypothetical protein
MKKTNFKAFYNPKTQEYDIMRFGDIYFSFTEQELSKSGFTVVNNILYERTINK